MSTGRFSIYFRMLLFVAVSGVGSSVCASEIVVSEAAAVVPRYLTRDSLIVRATGVGALPLAAGPATTTVIDLDDFAVGADLGDVLDSVAGLQMSRYGGLGAAGSASMRGGNGSGIVVMIDGVPLADAQSGVIDLRTLPIDRFASAEIHRGLTPAGFGAFGGAGAINLISRAGGDAESAGTEVRLSAGSFGEAGARVLNRGHAPALGVSYSLLLHGRRSDNGFEFLDHNQTFLESSDDRNRLRENAWIRENGLVFSARLEGGFTDLSCRGSLYSFDGGRPGPVGGNESPHAELRNQRRDVHLRAGSTRSPLQFDAYAVHGEECLIDIEQEVGGDPAGTVVSGSGQLYLRAIGRRELDLPRSGGFVVIEGGSGIRRQDYDQRLDYALQDGALIDPTRERKSLTLFGSLTLYSPGGRVSLGPSLSWRRLEDDFPALPPLPSLAEIPLDEPHVVEHTSPALSLSWDVVPGRWHLESHGSLSVREPTWVELFGHRGGVSGNRDLQAEDLRNLDLSLRYSRGRRLLVRTAIFESRAEQTIIWRRNSQYTSRAFNAGASRTRGVELEMIGALASRLRWWGNLTWQQARDRSVDYWGKALPYLSDLELAAGAALRAGGWEVGLQISHESASYRDRYNTPEDQIPARTIPGVSLTRRLDILSFPASFLRLDVINLNDSRVYDIEGYPLPGRSYRLSLSFR